MRHIHTPLTGLLAALTLCLAACGGGGRDDEDAPVDVMTTGIVTFGRLAGADVEVYAYKDLDTPVLTTTTTAGADLASAARFDIDLGEVPGNELFLIVVRGGNALDINADGVLDAAPTANLATVHAFATARRLAEGPVRVSAASELVYHRTRFLAAAGYESDLVARSADSWAGFILRSSVDAAPGVDRDDLVSFDLVQHTANLLRPAPAVRSFVASAIQGDPIENAAMDLTHHELGTVELPSNGRGLDVTGSVAYVASSFGGVSIIDVSEPTTPTILDTYVTVGSAHDVVFFGNHAAIADTNAGIDFVDVSDPTQPVFVAHIPMQNPYDLALRGDRLYVFANSLQKQFHIIDISDPSQPAIIGSEDLSFTAYDLIVHGNYAYLALSDKGFEVIEIGNELDPDSLGRIDIEDARAYGLAVKGNHLLVAESDGIEVFSLAVPSAPEPVAYVKLGGSNGTGGFEIVDDLAYLTRSFDGVQVVDVRNPLAPRNLGVLSTDGSQSDLVVRDGLIYVSDGNSAFHVVARGFPAPSAVVADLPLPFPTKVAVQADRAYVGAGNDLYIVDIGDPTDLELLGTTEVQSNINALQVRGSYAFAATIGMEVIDVTNPTLPFVAGGHIDIDGVTDMVLVDDVIYASASFDGLKVIDISTPTSPLPVLELPADNISRGVAHDGITAVLAHGFPGVAFFDTTDELNPQFTANEDTRNAVDVRARSGYAYVSEFSGNGLNNALAVLSYANPLDPIPVEEVYLPDNPGPLVLDGDYAYVSGSVSGVLAVGIENPNTPYLAGWLPTPSGNVGDVVVQGAYIYAIDTYHRLLVLRAAQRNVP